MIASWRYSKQERRSRTRKKQRRRPRRPSQLCQDRIDARSTGSGSKAPPTQTSRDCRESEPPYQSALKQNKKFVEAARLAEKAREQALKEHVTEIYDALQKGTDKLFKKTDPQPTRLQARLAAQEK